MTTAGSIVQIESLYHPDMVVLFAKRCHAERGEQSVQVPSSQHKPKTSPLMAAAKGLAATGSWLCVFIAAPLMHRAVDPAVRTFTVQEYDASYCDLASFAALILTGCFCYFATSLVLTATLIPAALKLSARTLF